VGEITKQDPTQSPLEAGRWRVKPGSSSATFTARGFWGAVPVTGRFTDPTGAVAIDADGQLSGELVIPAATLSTGIGLRDRHLRSAQFFHVRRHPQIRFAALRLTAGGGGGTTISGKLAVRDRSIELVLPVQVEHGPEQTLTLTAETVLELEPLGLGHSPLGMVRGPASVHVRVVLERER
jgi:polyisoprenoid-binding protein YceI